MPATIPDKEPIEINELGELHVPPDTVLSSVTLLPMQTDAGPVMAAGTASTVTSVVTKQPPPE
jgi:hypothetical protein